MWKLFFGAETKAVAMDASSLEEFVYDPSACARLSMEQKRELVYEVSKWPDMASEMLHAWSRQEILQILCAELGKERKYTGLTKSKIIEQLFKVINEKKLAEIGTDVSESPSLENGERTPKRQRKYEHPNHLHLTSTGSVTAAPDVDKSNSVYCKNSACKATMDHRDVFCKRCSCCICHQYDDNKDPSLWLICSADPPFLGLSCGMSCHLECALRHENSGISQDRQDKGLDGSFCCVSCGKVNDLLGSWRKQLLVARDTRRVDILCYRLYLGQRILGGTKHYQDLYSMVDEAVKKLEKEVGPLTGLPVKKARGIVNRLSSGPEIQKLCASAVESLDLMISARVSDIPYDICGAALELVKLRDISASSLSVTVKYDGSNTGSVMGYSLWHRKADDIDYPAEPICRLFKPNTMFLLAGLTPSTNYCLKAAPFDDNREMKFFEFQFQTEISQDEIQDMNSKNLEMETSQSPTTNCSSLSNPSSAEDETTTILPSSDNDDENRGYLPFCGNADKATPMNSLGDPVEVLQKKTTEDAVCLLDGECSRANNGCKISGDSLLNARCKELSNGLIIEEANDHGRANTPALITRLESVPYMDSSETGLPITPSKFENVKQDTGRSIGTGPKFNEKAIVIGLRGEPELQAGSSSKKRNEETRREGCNGIGDKDFEYYVRVVRWLECEGHIETSFRQKFLTWYSLRATPQEVRVVKVFIDTFIEDPESLAGQLLDTFSGVVSNKSSSTVPAGFCAKLWH